MSDHYEGEDRRSPAPERWHLKKEVNISIIAVLVGQLVVAAIAWGNMENRVTQLETTGQRFAQIPERLASIEATLIAIKEQLRAERR